METENDEKYKLRNHLALVWILLTISSDVLREELTN